jgi:hypothetical protein
MSCNVEETMNNDDQETILIFAGGEPEQSPYGNTRGLEKVLQNVSAKVKRPPQCVCWGWSCWPGSE